MLPLRAFDHRFRACAVACALALLAGPAALAEAPDAVALGRAKYVQCASCHGSDGRATVIPQYPKIGGQNAEYVVIALKGYRERRRQGTWAAMMTEVAKPLSDTEIANLAAYVETLGAGR